MPLTRSLNLLTTGLLAATLAGCAAAPDSSAPSTPEAVTFSSSLTAVTLQSTLPDSGERLYEVPAVAGAMVVAHAVASGDTDLTVEVLHDGQPATAAASSTDYWSGTAPGGSPLLVKVTGAAGTAFVIDLHKPRRLILDEATGAAMATVSLLPHGEADYVVHSRAGARLIVEMRASSAAPYISITRLSDGEMLLAHEVAGDMFDDVTAEAGEYLVSVVGDAVATEVELHVSVQAAR